MMKDKGYEKCDVDNSNLQIQGALTILDSRFVWASLQDNCISHLR